VASAFAKQHPFSEEGRVLQPGADPKKFLVLDLLASGEFSMLACGDDGLADLPAAGSVACAVLPGEGEQRTLQVIEGILTYAFDQRSERET